VGLELINSLSRSQGDNRYLKLDASNDPITELLTLNKGLLVNNTEIDVDTRFAALAQTNALFVQGSDGFVGIGTATPSDELTVVGNCDISGTLAVGNFASVDPLKKLNVTGSANSASSVFALDFQITQSGNGDVYGVNGIATGSGVTKTNIYGGFFIANKASGATAVTNLIGCRLVTSDIGGGGSITNAIGLSIGDITQGTNNWVIDAGTGDVRFAGGNVVFNESGLDADYRIEGSGDANLFFLDAGNDQVFIGQATGNTGVKFEVNGNISVGGSNNELRFYEGVNYVGFEAPALTGDQIWVLPAADGSADDIIKTDGSGNLSFVTPTTAIPIVLSSYDAVPARGSETNLHGGLLSLATAQPLDSVPTDIVITKGIGKIMIVVNAGSDLAGDITVTGTSVDRDTGATVGSDTDTITVDAVSTDGSDTDGNGNARHSFTGAYITSKWFTGTVTLSTTNLTLTDVDVYHVSFEQFNDSPDLVLTTFDVNMFTTNVNAEFDAYLYCLEVTGDKCDVIRCSSLNVGTDGETAIANKYWRLRRGDIARSLDGTTDGLWADIHYSNSPVYIEDVTIKIWATKTQALTLT